MRLNFHTSQHLKFEVSRAVFIAVILGISFVVPMLTNVVQAQDQSLTPGGLEDDPFPEGVQHTEEEQEALDEFLQEPDAEPQQQTQSEDSEDSSGPQVGENPVSVGNPLEPGFGLGNQDADRVGISYLQGRLVQLTLFMIQLLTVLTAIPILYGSYLWITSRGESERVEQGKKTFFWGVAGLILGIMAMTLMNILLTAATGAGQG